MCTVIALASCSSAATSDAVDDAKTAGSAQGSGLTVNIVNNNTNYTPDQVWWYVMSGSSVVSGPTKLSTSTSYTTSSLSAGQLYIVYNSAANPLPYPPPTPTPPATNPPPSPDTSQERFDVVELTYPGNPATANLTSVAMFGIPLDLSATDSSGTPAGSKIWNCYTDDIKASVSDAMAASGGTYSNAVRTDANGNFLRLVSPNIVSGLNPTGYPDFTSYLSSLTGKKLTVQRKKGVDFALYSYKYSGTVAANGSIVLKPAKKSGNTAVMTIPAGSLTGNGVNTDYTGIYGNNSPYLVNGQQQYVNTNDLHAAVYRDLVAGFTWGFWGSPEYPANNSFQFNVSEGSGPYAGAQTTPSNFDSWGAALWPYTDSYGFAFSDTFNPDRSPLLTLPTNGTLNVTIQPDKTPGTCTPRTD